MICRRCLQRLPALRHPPPSSTATLSRASPSASSPPATTSYHRLPLSIRTLTQTPRRLSSSPAPQPPPAGATAPGQAPPSPSFGTPLGDAAAAEDATANKPSLSTCPEGTVLSGLNYFKNKSDPVALADDAYPAWLWDCLKVQQKADEEGDGDAADEFSKSKKQRRIAAKRQRILEAKLLAAGNLEALAPKVPLQQQTINLPSNEEGTLAGAMAAVDAREALRRAARKERKAKIKESNYLKSM
ncbi:mitochondrial ribosomal protein L37-domain-containing protein [Xylariomycetidae sp. FL2044]|nr:mitochondrial ribosomal protein L37-domain-containing protein [Xylariomycetidae sp. FL2044]